MSTIIQNENGRFIASTQRADGSWRKERRVKDGYTPQEEVPLYESRGKQWASSQPRYPPGLDPALVTEKEVTSQKKKKKPQTQPPPVSRDLIKEAVTKTFTDTPPVMAEEKWETVGSKGRGNKNENKSTNKPAKKTEQTKKETNTLVHQKSQQAPKKSQQEPEQVTDPTKRLRNLRKKLKEIEQLEIKIKTNELKKPDKDQLSKVARKAEIEEEVALLEEQLASSSLG